MSIVFQLTIGAELTLRLMQPNHKPLKTPVKSGTFKGFLFSKIFDKFLLKKYLLSNTKAIAVKKETIKNRAPNLAHDYIYLYFLFI